MPFFAEVFRVIVVLPNFPEGSFFSPEVQVVMKWTYETICRGETSIMSQLQQAGVPVYEFITFHQLRSWGHLDQVRLSSFAWCHWQSAFLSQGNYRALCLIRSTYTASA